MPADDRAAFARLILALRPYLADLVLIGGWAHRLFRLHPLSQPTPFAPLLTQDVDLATPQSLASRHEDLRGLLLQAGFTERLVGQQRPPVTYYQLGTEAFYAEFLTPLRGRGIRRDGTADRTAHVAGVTTQKLRHLELLLVVPWRVGLGEPDYPVGPTAIEVRIANATSYLAQKLLVLPRRDRRDQAKDLLYVHDTLLTFGRSLPQLRTIWTEHLAPTLHPRAVRTVRHARHRLVGEVTDLARHASRIAQDAGRPLAPEDLVAVCRAGLAEVFG